jgi:hypothetical protein
MSTYRQAPDWQPTATDQCVCGAPVGSDLVRVFGVGGLLPACECCWVAADRDYETTVSAVMHYHNGTGYPEPDVDIDARLAAEVGRDV